MPDTRIDSSVASNLSGTVVEYSVDSALTDGAGDSQESTYQNNDWSSDYGYYLNIPEFKRAVDTKALWTIGGGFQSDEATTMLLSTIKGNGKDSFNGILSNMIKVKTISGDAFAEIIRDDSDRLRPLINLKPLDPSSIVIVQNRKGQIVRYEQVSKSKAPNKRYSPDRIFHLSHQRIADEIGGTRIIPSIKWLIDARNEAMDDWRTMLHRNVKPMRIWYLDTDDATEIASFKSKTDGANKDTENLYVPKGTVETEIASVAPNATLNALPWVESLKDAFFQAVNVPQIIIGQGKEFTDASGKIVYLSYEQSVKEEQLYVEEQVLSQLNVEINLVFPASLQQELISSRDKDSDLQASQPNDQMVELEGRK